MLISIFELLLKKSTSIFLSNLFFKSNKTMNLSFNSFRFFFFFFNKVIHLSNLILKSNKTINLSYFK